jgi:hypothetical protein
MLGPQGHLYETLSSPSSIRTLLLAPGQPEEDIFCFILPCDLDKDSTIDASSPPAFRWSCSGFSAGLDDKGETKRLKLPLDVYSNDDEKAKEGVDLHVHPFQRFIALSYVWGSAEDIVYITVNGKRFGVTRNLFDALKFLRPREDGGMLWVDAICINQDDPEEKKIQIALMRRVYRQAQSVTAFVSLVQKDTEILKDLFTRIYTAGKKCKEVLESGDIPKQQLNKDRELMTCHHDDRPLFQVVPLQSSGTFIEDYGVPAKDDAAWKAWRRFFASPYFRRIWILQEFALATDLNIQFGGATCKMDIIILVYMAVQTRSRFINAHYLACDEDPDMARAASLSWSGLGQMIKARLLRRLDLHGVRSREKLIDILANVQYFDASDPRDKIYAVMGMASDGDIYTDLVSYHTSVTYPDVYRCFARAFIEQGYILQVLHMACCFPKSIQLPSWVPVSSENSSYV